MLKNSEICVCHCSVGYNLSLPMITMLVCRLLVTRLLLLVDHEIHTLPEHLSSSRFIVAQILVFCIVSSIFSTIACLFVHSF